MSLTDGERQEIRQLINEESDEADSGGLKRRGFLGLAGMAALAGSGGGAAASNLNNQQPPLAVGGSLDVADAYHIAGDFYAGPRSARPGSPGSNAIWLVTDSGADFLTKWTYYNGSVWKTLGMDTDVVRTDRAHTNSRAAEVVIHKDDAGSIVVDGPDGGISFTGEITDAIKAAENAGPADGWHIHVAAGQYDITGTFADGDQLTLEKPTKLTGSGYGTHLRVVDGTTDTADGISIINWTSSGVTLQDLRVDGNQQNNGGDGDGKTISNSTDGHNIRPGSDTGGGDDFTIRGVWSVNSTGDGIEPTQCTNGTIENCVLKANYEHNIHFNSCENVTATGVVAVGGVQNGSIRTFAATGETTRDCSLSDSIIADSQTGGVRLSSGAGSLVGFTMDNVTVVNPTDECFIVTEDISQADNVPEDITVTDCTFREGSEGAEVKVGVGVELKNNTIVRNDGNGVIVDPGTEPGNPTDVAIDDNVINNNGVSSASFGILARTRGQTIDRLRIRRNDVLSLDADAAYDNGIFVKVDSGGSYTNSLARDNHVDGATNAARNGFENIGTYAGESTFSGDGSTTTFTVTHGLPVAATPVSILPDASTAATDIAGYKNVVSGSFDVEFSSAPASGTDNVTVSWAVEEAA